MKKIIKIFGILLMFSILCGCAEQQSQTPMEKTIPSKSEGWEPLIISVVGMQYSIIETNDKSKAIDMDIANKDIELYGDDNIYIGAERVDCTLNIYTLEEFKWGYNIASDMDVNGTNLSYLKLYLSTNTKDDIRLSKQQIDEMNSKGYGVLIVVDSDEYYNVVNFYEEIYSGKITIRTQKRLHELPGTTTFDIRGGSNKSFIGTSENNYMIKIHVKDYDCGLDEIFYKGEYQMYRQYILGGQVYALVFVDVIDDEIESNLDLAMSCHDAKKVECNIEVWTPSVYQYGLQLPIPDLTSYNVGRELLYKTNVEFDAKKWGD